MTKKQHLIRYWFCFIIVALVLLNLDCIQSKAPKAPNDLKLVERQNGIELRWNDNSATEKGFMVFRNDTMIANPVRMRAMFYLDTHKIYNDTVRYFVRAYNDHGVSDSEIKTIFIKSLPKLYAPYGFNATPGFQKVLLGWQDSSKTTILYQISRNDTLIANLTDFETVYLDTIANYATEYNYKVRGIAFEDTTEWIELKTKTLGNWKAIWDKTFWYIFNGDTVYASGYLLAQVIGGNIKKLYIGNDTTAQFKYSGYPCAGVFAFGIIHGDSLFSDMSEVVCIEN